MARVSAIHHPLSDVNTDTRDIGAIIYILHPIDGPTVNSHPQPNVRTRLQRRCNLHGAMNRFLRRSKENQRHSVTRRYPNQLSGCLAVAKLRSFSDDLIEFLNQLALLFNEELGIADDIDEQDVR